MHKLQEKMHGVNASAEQNKLSSDDIKHTVNTGHRMITVFFLIWHLKMFSEEKEVTASTSLNYLST